jgi:uncharacterized protein
MLNQMKKYFPLFLILLFIGCASYQNKVEKARSLIADGDPKGASEILSTMSNQEGKDQVLYMLDYALALHEAGEYKKSIDTLIEVDRLAESKDYISLSRQAGSLFLNESMIQYKSERFENLLINAYLALNFTLLGDYENALVECRRLDEKLYKQKLDNEDNRKNYYARYLSAMIWEAEKNWDSSYIDYNNAYKINPNHEYLKKDLIRAAWKARRPEELQKWEKMFPSYKLADIKKESVNNGEVIFIYQQGWIPRKYPRPENFRFPHLVRQASGFRQAIVEVDGKRQKPTEMLYEVGNEAIRTLDNDFNYLVAKKIIGVVAKEVMASQIRQKNELLGAIASIAMHAADQADVRQWSTLPDTFQITKLSLPPGKHKLIFFARGPAGESKIGESEVDVKKEKKIFLTERTFY